MWRLPLSYIALGIITAVVVGLNAFKTSEAQRQPVSAASALDA
jgi:hypothetical protein